MNGHVQCPISFKLQGNEMQNQQSRPSIIRADIEQHLIEQAKHISNNPETGCFDEQAINEFINGWQDLVAYYESTDDRTINIEIVRDYLYWSSRFGEISIARKDPVCAEIADDACEDLMGAMLKVISIV